MTTLTEPSQHRRNTAPATSKPRLGKRSVDASERPPRPSGGGESVFAAVSSDLDASQIHSGLAAAALSLARELDNPTVSATAKAACARSLVIVLNALRGDDTTPPAPDGLDAIIAKRGRE